MDYPVEHVRWTENRNMREFVRLLDDRLSVEPLVTHRFDIEDADDAYDLIMGSEASLGVLLEYGSDDRFEDRIELPAGSRTAKDATNGRLSVGLVGAGNFAKKSLLPVLSDSDRFSLHAVASGTGKTAEHVGKKYNAAYCTTDYSKVIADENVDVVVVATRHDLHAEVTISALNQQKNVHVEKPPALDAGELSSIVDAERSSAGRLMVGYNRRFAPATAAAKEAFSGENIPLCINYRVNADRIPSDHWIHDRSVGGGRIVGEVCHFIDFAQCVTDSLPDQVWATEVDDQADENVQISVEFADGSVASIMYTTLGDSSLSKERVELFGGNRIKTIDNFKTGFLNLNQQKGYTEEFQAFADAIAEGEPSPIPITDIVHTSIATFAIEESLRSSKPASVNIEDFLSES
jgi:predicted dehydrogenase